MKKRILVVEDEDKLRRILELQLLDSGFDVVKASSAEEALPLIDRAELILTDFKLPGMTGLEMLQLVRRQDSHVPVIVMTAFGTIENAVDAMKAGAVDFLQKPFSLDHLTLVVNKALEVRNLRDENRRLKEELGRKYQWDNIVGRSSAMQQIFATIMRVAPTRATVLLAGESGVGKDLIARAIHFHSPRRDKPFVKINCTAIPENLMESELFGYEKGAFTGANISKPGKFEQADTGTVMLDEIGDVPANVQVKLLRVLQEHCLRRVGGRETIAVDARVLAATHHDLETAIRDKTFREDLYYRLNVVSIHLPALRQRKEDIPALVRYFLGKYGPELGHPSPSIHAGALEFLQSHSWPGNVRELENALRKALLLAQGYTINADHVRAAITQTAGAPAPATRTLGEWLDAELAAAQRGETTEVHAKILENAERELFRRAIALAEGNQARAARWLGVSRITMKAKLVQFGFHPHAENQAAE